MKKFLLRMAAGAATLACIGAAQATVLTFDGLAPSPLALNMPLLGHNDEFYQSGYWFDPFSNDPNAVDGDLVGAIVNGADVANTCSGVVCPTNNSTNFYTALNDGVLAVGRIDSALFKLTGLQASFVGASGDAFPAGVTLLLRAQGVKADNTSTTADIQLPGPVNGVFSFNSYAYSAAFANTEFQYVFLFGLACNAGGSCSAFTSDKGQFAVDNISVVPEPGQWLLLGLGLAALAPLARRRMAR